MRWPRCCCLLLAGRVNLAVCMVIVCVLLSAQAKPSFSFNLPRLAVFGGPFAGGGEGANAGNTGNANRKVRRSLEAMDYYTTAGGWLSNWGVPGVAGLATNDRDARDALKTYSGQRVANDSLRMVYFHDQTVAVVELGPNKLLLNCELLEVYEPEDVVKYLGELQSISRPIPITLKEMMTLMGQCQQVDTAMRTVAAQAAQAALTAAGRSNVAHVRSLGGSARGGGLLANNPFVLLSGIIPGTKWCGTGDIALSYHDLGAEPLVDRCCRSHDLCPVKVRAYSQRYNLTNNSLYTKSHCACDDNLFECLKQSDSPNAHIMGNIYFNLIQVPCVQETSTGARQFRAARNIF